MITPANNPAFYFPPASGVYEIKPGLTSLQTDFGNGSTDKRVFQFDCEYPTYHDNKLKARDESAEKYICLVPGKDYSIVNRFILNTLCNEYPEFFSFNIKTGQLDCRLLGKQLSLSDHASFDTLAMLVQEDLAVMEIDESGESKIIALHLCAPNHWAAQDKMGKDFISIHAPVPEMERINKRNREINKACLNKGPYVRFAWGLSTDKYLNHHPQPPVDKESQQWCGRQFNPDDPELFMRVERQTLTGFKNEGQILFTIRTYFYDVADLNTQYRRLLLNAIYSMTDETLSYKGIMASKNDICHWLESSL